MADPLTLAITAVTTLVSAYGQHQQGIAANRALKLEAKQMEIAAGQERAASQRNAAEERRQANIALSNATAAAAASGGGAADPSVITNKLNLAREGEYRSLMRLYEGEQSGRNYENQALIKRYEGQQKVAAGRINAMTTLVSGASGMYGKFGGGTVEKAKASVGKAKV